MRKEGRECENWRSGSTIWNRDDAEVHGREARRDYYGGSFSGDSYSVRRSSAEWEGVRVQFEHAHLSGV